MPQFDLHVIPSQIFWLIISFSALYFLVKYFLFPKMDFIFSNRESLIKSYIIFSEQAHKEILLKREEQKQQRQQLVASAEKLKEDSLRDIEKEEALSISTLSDKVGLKTEEAISDISKWANDFRYQEQKVRLDLAGFFINKITNKSVDLELLTSINGKIDAD
jgi:F-type H+-transporting ATPase subunit b